ncbi:metallophosphoesterase family protein [Oleidesulfovibrio sp.]|uniref:metallophosphoesterase family protein n=1 Tax=Oleidesulfovibrio sp. TaxID=2909707 RepID=UPI003A846A6C
MTSHYSRRAFLKAGTIFTSFGLTQQLCGSLAFAAPAAMDFGTVSFGVISDPHVDIKGVNEFKMSAGSVDCVAASVAALNQHNELKFVMVCGDLLLDGEKENAIAIKAELDKLKAPYFVVAGNHDFKPAKETALRSGFNYMSIDDFVRFFRGHGYDKSGKRFYAQQIVPGLRVIGLDANLPGDTKWGGVLPDEQLQWLEHQLSSHTDAMHVVFIHHNLVRWSADELEGGPKQWFTIDNAPQVRALLSKYAAAVPVVISGHRHIGLNLRQINGVNYFTSPSVNSHPMRFTIYDINKDGISWQTQRVPMPTQFHLSARENMLNSTWWRQSECAERNSFTDEQVLDLYENNAMQMGSMKLKS